MPLQTSPTRSRPSVRQPRHDAVCTDCDAVTSLPFRPTPGRPVYCRPCFRKRRGDPAPPNGGAAAASPRVTNAANDAAVHAEAPPAAIRSPAPTGAAFADMALRPATRAALAAMDIVEPTPIQAQTVPHLLSGCDVIGQARTGSGKTLAFAVPAVERCDAAVRGVQALILVPIRELAMQVAEVIGALVAGPKSAVTLLYGGRSARPEQAALRRGARIVVGTPGRTLDHLRQGNLDLRGVRFLVLDEADEMLDKGFARDVEAILARTPAERQTALFSATMPGWVAQMAKKHLRQPVTVEIDRDLGAAPTVSIRCTPSRSPTRWVPCARCWTTGTRIPSSSSARRNTASASWRNSSTRWAIRWRPCRAISGRTPASA